MDDEPMVRMLVVETLEEQGYRTFEAEDVPSALMVLNSSQPINLLVTDVTLPGQNGRQLADAAKQIRPGLKVLFMTGYAHNIEVGNGSAMAEGMEIITKPFSLDGLAKKIQSMMAD
ncbi:MULTISPECIES: response regulator [Acidocella]|uniref:response regulator n=1 Tax=Acidocella TaxID=50709 RepID=UPI001969F08E|nr:MULTISPECIES: response regulator [Acidocella]WBO59475.1 response regulator [Acidocella sp. MX-AZ03]